MKKFIKNVVLFITPFLLFSPILLWFVYIGYRTGELKDADEVILEQRENDSTLLGLAYNEQNAYYKISNANYYQADVIAVGTSRVMQIRNDYFTTSFYNCGGGANENFDSYLNFIKNLEYKPQVIILGLDCWVFNDNWNRGLMHYEDYRAIEKTKRSKLSLVKALISDWNAKKWSRDTLSFFPNNIGINGIVKNNGFRNDCSYCYGDTYLHPESQPDYQFMDTIERINNGVSRFEYGDHIDSETIKLLDNLLAYCEGSGIYVVGFTAPLAPGIYERMEHSGNYGYLDEIVPECNRIFSEHGFGLYDYLDGESLGYGDEYYVDGFHGGDIVYAEIVKRIAEHVTEVAFCVDYDLLLEIVKNNEDFLVFD